MADFHIKQNDTNPAIEATLTDEDLVALDLNTATGIKFHMINPSTGVVKVDAVAAIDDAPTGRVRYQWASGETDTPGTYNGEFQVTWNDSTVTSFPNNGYIEIKITKEVA